MHFSRFVHIFRQKPGHILRQRGRYRQAAAGDGVGQLQPVGVQGRTGDQVPVLLAVEPVPRQRVANGGQVQPQLVGAARLRQQPQQGQLPRQKGLVERSGGKAHRVHGAAEQRAGVPADGQIDAAGGGLGRTQTDAPVLPLEAVRVEAPAEEITGDYIFYYEPGEQFVIDGQTVRVESAALDAEELLATVYWEKEPTYTPELYALSLIHI